MTPIVHLQISEDQVWEQIESPGRNGAFFFGGPKQLKIFATWKGSFPRFHFFGGRVLQFCSCHPWKSKSTIKNNRLSPRKDKFLRFGNFNHPKSPKSGIIILIVFDLQGESLNHQLILRVGNFNPKLGLL